LEAELAVIIGKDGKHISKENAMSHVFGYTIANDVSGRDWQKKRNGGQWLLGKTFDTFCPIGPIVDTDLDPSNLSIKSWIDDELMQESNTKFLVFDIPVSFQNYYFLTL
jgi:2-keto-4-pentenoate hydratase/2-oxohepta-3-ene-1,7-dioic acid hydratase in catechol pathway